MDEDDTVEALLDDTCEGFDHADEDYCHNVDLIRALDEAEHQTLALIDKARPSPTPWLHTLVKQIQAVQNAMFLARVRLNYFADPAPNDEYDDDIAADDEGEDEREVNEAGEAVVSLDLNEAADILAQMRRND